MREREKETCHTHYQLHMRVSVCLCLCVSVHALTLSMFTQAYHPEDVYGARLKYRLATAGEKGFYKCRDDDGRCTASTAEEAFADPPSAQVGLGDSLCVCVPHSQTRTRTHIRRWRMIWEDGWVGGGVGRSKCVWGQITGTRVTTTSGL